METILNFLLNYGNSLLKVPGTIIKKIIKEKNGLLDPYVRKYWWDLRSKENQKKYWFATPDTLCLYRMLCGVILGVMIFPNLWVESFGIFLLVIGWITDLLDGLVARAFNIFSKYGAILDPIADKLLHLPVFVHYFKDSPFLLFAMFFSEISLIFLRRFKKMSEIKANYFGKSKMGVQFLSLLAKIVQLEITAFSLFVLAVILGFASLLKQIIDSPIPGKIKKNMLSK